MTTALKAATISENKLLRISVTISERKYFVHLERKREITYRMFILGVSNAEMLGGTYLIDYEGDFSQADDRV